MSVNNAFAQCQPQCRVMSVREELAEESHVFRQMTDRSPGRHLPLHWRTAGGWHGAKPMLRGTCAGCGGRSEKLELELTDVEALTDVSGTDAASAQACAAPAISSSWHRRTTKLQSESESVSTCDWWDCNPSLCGFLRSHVRRSNACIHVWLEMMQALLMQAAAAHVSTRLRVGTPDTELGGAQSKEALWWVCREPVTAAL
ncbi:unnamed protein product [Pleuronectes platessa]|uniref:Uncharacterized protein n=1 Tax=Pleuronectes platessa TaxID=8262 RepID=A0A9N7Y8Z0_PLEPL|nr:unnamed protein product [Pleuronectes platessa]